MADSATCGSVFIAGYYGFDNAGDEAILSCMLEHLRALRPGLDIRVASGNPEQTAARYGVRSLPWNDTPAVRSAVEQCGLVLVGGGGLFHDYWGVDPDAFLTDRHWGTVYFAGPALLAMLYEKPLMLYAVGVGPLSSTHARSFTRAACEAANVVTVRDAGSRALLESIGVDGARIAVTADPALAFSQDGGGVAPTAPAPVLGVSLRPWAIGAFPEFWEREVAAALDAFVERHGGSILFLPFQTLAGDRENDIAVAERVRAAMRTANSARLLSDSSPQSLYAAIGQCSAVLGMRLHSLIFAFLNRRPFVALSYDPKVGEFLRATGIEGLAADISGVEAARLTGMLDRAMAQADRFGVPLDGLRRELACLARENACAAIRLLESSSRACIARSAAPLLARALKVHQTANADLTARLQAANAAAAQLDDARKLLADSAAGLAVYRSRMADELKTYRSQRAWTAMLAIRKGYTLLTHEGKLAFGKWVLRLPFNGPGPLDPYELPFPDVAENVPPALLERPAGNRGPMVGRQRKYDLIVFAIIDFDFRFQRPQQIAAQFAREGHRVFWISPTRFLPPSSPEPYRLMVLRDNLWEVHLRGRQPDIYLGRLSPELAGSMADGLRALCREGAVSESVALIQLPFWRQAALRLRQDHGCPVIYDCMDEWATFPNMGAFNITEEQDLVREADVLVVSGNTLLEKFRATGLEPVLARNGVDFEFYNQPHAPADLRLARPVIGYFGAIADWMDLELVRAAALARPQYSFVMVGQVFRGDIATIDLPNVHLAGSRPYAEIPSYLERFDVCVIPFVLNQVTKATDPVKLYEYLARGKPVVATAMAELAACGDLIYIARNADDYAAQLDRAVAENDPALRERRMAYAAANTWQQRCHTIDAAIRGRFPLISIIVVTHNSGEFVGPCMESIAAETPYPNYEVILVDNASTDSTVEAIRAHMPAGDARFQFIHMPANAGFAAANNAGARAARGDYLVLLNSDTVVTSGWLGRLLSHLQRDPGTGLVCPVTNFAGNEAMIDVSYVSAEAMQSFAQELARDREGRRLELEVAPLFCVMIRKSLWQELDGLDERYEVGMFEDDDFSLKVRRRGLRVVAAEDCFVHHFGQGSFAQLPAETYEKIFQENRRRFEEKWKVTWKAHQPRPNVKPAYARTRFHPAPFCRQT